MTNANGWVLPKWLVELIPTLATVAIGCVSSYFLLREQIAGMPAAIFAEADKRYVRVDIHDMRLKYMGEDVSRIQRDVAELRARSEVLPELKAKIDELGRAIEAKK